MLSAHLQSSMQHASCFVLLVLLIASAFLGVVEGGLLTASGVSKSVGNSDSNTTAAGGGEGEAEDLALAVGEAEDDDQALSALRNQVETQDREVEKADDQESEEEDKDLDSILDSSDEDDAADKDAETALESEAADDDSSSAFLQQEEREQEHEEDEEHADQCEDFMAEVDTNKDGKVSLEEVQQMIERGTEEGLATDLKTAGEDTHMALKAEAEQDKSKAAKLFTLNDLNKDGFLDAAEVSTFVRSMDAEDAKESAKEDNEHVEGEEEQEADQEGKAKQVKKVVI